MLRELEKGTSRYWLTGTDIANIERWQQLKSSGETREGELRVMHETMNEMLRVLTAAVERFSAERSKFGSNQALICFPQNMSHSCEISA